MRWAGIWLIGEVAICIFIVWAMVKTEEGRKGPVTGEEASLAFKIFTLLWTVAIIGAVLILESLKGGG